MVRICRRLPVVQHRSFGKNSLIGESLPVMHLKYDKLNLLSERGGVENSPLIQKDHEQLSPEEH
jgi:hypothetical protein